MKRRRLTAFHAGLEQIQVSDAAHRLSYGAPQRHQQQSQERAEYCVPAIHDQAPELTTMLSCCVIA